MRRQVPLVLCFAFGIVMVLTEFSPHPWSQGLNKEVINWGLIIGPVRACTRCRNPGTDPLDSYPAACRALAIQLCCIRWHDYHGADRCPYFSE